MAERESILARLREALRVPTAASVHPEAARMDARSDLPPGGLTREKQQALFACHAEALRAEFVVGPAAAALAEIAWREGWRRVASHHGPLTDDAVAALGLPVLWTDGGYAAADLERVDAAVTGCEALIAQTGSVLVTARSCGGRALSVLPPHHVVLARIDQLVPDLTAGYERLRATHGERLPSSISLITGPSRTGDIERILVLGAHGPAKLTIILCDE
jgi:L-lactate dehydrogenase complex protein LldG